MTAWGRQQRFELDRENDRSRRKAGVDRRYLRRVRLL
jgi:hypothetical protein